MSRSPHVTVQVDLARVRDNARAIKERVRADVLAVVKADAYGLGAAHVIVAIEDLVDGFCFFNLHEVVDVDYATLSSKPAITFQPPLRGPGVEDTCHLDRQHVRPVVASIEQAEAWRDWQPVLSVDTGQQRFACPPAEVDAALRAGKCHRGDDARLDPRAGPPLRRAGRRPRAAAARRRVGTARRTVRLVRRGAARLGALPGGGAHFGEARRGARFDGAGRLHRLCRAAARRHPLRLLQRPAGRAVPGQRPAVARARSGDAVGVRRVRARPTARATRSCCWGTG